MSSGTATRCRDFGLAYWLCVHKLERKTRSNERDEEGRRLARRWRGTAWVQALYRRYRFLKPVAGEMLD